MDGSEFIPPCFTRLGHVFLPLLCRERATHLFGMVLFTTCTPRATPALLCKCFLNHTTSTLRALLLLGNDLGGKAYFKTVCWAAQLWYGIVRRNSLLGLRNYCLNLIRLYGGRHLHQSYLAYSHYFILDSSPWHGMVFDRFHLLPFLCAYFHYFHLRQKPTNSLAGVFT